MLILLCATLFAWTVDTLQSCIDHPISCFYNLGAGAKQILKVGWQITTLSWLHFLPFRVDDTQKYGPDYEDEDKDDLSSEELSVLVSLQLAQNHFSLASQLLDPLIPGHRAIRANTDQLLDVHEPTMEALESVKHSLRAHHRSLREAESLANRTLSRIDSQASRWWFKIWCFFWRQDIKQWVLEQGSETQKSLDDYRNRTRHHLSDVINQIRKPVEKLREASIDVTRSGAPD